MVEKSGGDVGCYWLNYAEPLIALHPATKFICLKRDRAKTVRSWARRMKGRMAFGIYIMYVDADGRMHAPSLFPDYSGLSMEEAAGCYWDEYYNRAEKLQERYPEQFRIYSMLSVLNDRKCLKEMFRFAGLERKTSGIENRNKGGIRDPEFGNMLADWAAAIIRDQEIRPGMRALLTPSAGHRLGVLAVERGISKKDTDDIVMEFNRVEDGSVLGYGESFGLGS
jgi:hypothetical protein